MKIRNATKREWIDIVDNCTNTTFFHTYEWYKVWSEYHNCRMLAKLITMEEKQTAILPLLHKNFAKGLGNQYISSPSGTYGGILSNNKFIDHKKILKVIFGRKNYNIVYPPKINIKADFYDHTYVLYLDSLNEGEITKNWSRSHKRNYKKAIEEITNYKFYQTENNSDWKEYYDLYHDFYYAKNNSYKNCYRNNLFPLIKDIIPQANRSLYILKIKNKIIAGQLLFSYNKTATLWNGIVDSKYKLHGTTHLFNYQLIKNLIRNKYTSIDFSPSNRNAGVEHFKKEYGTTKIKIPVITNHNLLAKAYRLYLNLRR